ncbi:carboxymuconolactone decarboxylase family protein [Aureliella helgolandensis]|uniref:Carboxymuconolactone decarboxylase family protein n=1 Tax=Aureliella helgolandensis TaxID=2527968 RepID=A0A518G8H6_9BACT|nr:hypothetical protein [Aureliella helgolandensis]QDV24884.1 hypothetical protein Q31a_32060 [Aureliella helgolandensis]
MKFQNSYIRLLLRSLFAFVIMGEINLQGQTAVDLPRPTPITRPEMKSLLETVKERTPRIPLPDLTERDREILGQRSDDYETRLKYHFLPQLDGAAMNGKMPRTGNSPRGNFRSSEEGMTLDYGFKVELFWIVSRVNNCQYCLGHQESKLLSAGRSEDRIAMLDGDWRQFQPAEQAAYAFARKFTFEPHLLVDEDIEHLTMHFDDQQIIEMILSMAWNNSINRWKEGVGVPQRQDEGGYSRLDVSKTPQTLQQVAESVVPLPRGSYETPTSPAFLTKTSGVAVVHYDRRTGRATTATVEHRPALEDRYSVLRSLAATRTRSARLPLVDGQHVAARLNLEQHSIEPQAWLRLLANFPQEGKRRAQALLAAEEDPQLDPLLVAQLGWIVARKDRAWYAAGRAMKKLMDLGQSMDEVFALDADWSGMSGERQALFTVAQNLAASPVVLTDAQVAIAVERTSPGEVTRVVNLVAQYAAFNRLTEAAGLALD